MRKLRIGTRGSKLAMTQTHMTIDALKKIYPDVQTEIVIIETTGDTSQKSNIALQKIGGKGLFADALNAAMDRDEVDVIVHSMKDLPSIRPEKYTIAAMLERADPRDVFLSNIEGVKRIEDLPLNAVVGTTSPRRAAIAKRKRPDLEVVVFRGNVDTRLQKLKDRFENVSATFLARAGLARLNLTDVPHTLLDAKEFLPPAGQGAVGIEVLTSDQDLIDFIKPIGCAKTFRCVTAERACLALLDGDCKTSISAYATEENGVLQLRSEIYSPDGKQMKAAYIEGAAENCTALGMEAGRSLLAQIDPVDYATFSVLAPAS